MLLNNNSSYKDSSIDELNFCLKSLGIKASCVSSKKHRNMAFYDLKIVPGMKIKSIQASAPEIAFALKSKSDPIVKPIPELGVVRIKVTNADPTILSFDDCRKQKDLPPNYSIPFLFGETDEGNKLWVDMAKNPHLLIAGTTGSGKSTLLHLLIENVKLLNNEYKYNIGLILSDPKLVEFAKYKDKKKYPYVEQISNDYQSTINILKNIQSLMEDRYHYFSKMKISSIEEMPNDFKRYFVIIDEVSFFMLSDKKSKIFERTLTDLAQRCRAAGIYLVLATQHPSVDVITGTIKANFPARVACKVSSKSDSRVVIDEVGAECLLGRGDAILKNYNNDFTRFQIAYVK